MQKDLPTDQQLFRELKEGDEQAFQKIYEKHVPELLGYAAQKLSSLEEARDIVQDIFLNFYERRAKIEIKTSIKSYLFSALRYKIIDHIRKNKNKRYYLDMLHNLSPKGENKVFSRLVYKDLNTNLEKEIKRLPQKIRETFLLSRREYLSISQIAEKRKVSEQTVKNQLTTAMKKLRPFMEKVMMVLVVLYFFFEVSI